MSQFLVDLHRAKENHVNPIIDAAPESDRANLSRLLTDAFIAGAKAATGSICQRERADIERLEAMESERQRQIAPGLVLMEGVEPGNLIRMATHGG